MPQPGDPIGPKNRRSVSGKPPTYLMQSYAGMEVSKKKELKRIGFGLLIFSFCVPVLASIGLRALTTASLPWTIWIFCGVGMIVGLSLAWPELGIYMLGRLPSAVSMLLPKSWASMLKRPDRRNGDAGQGD